ncbi:hypothetical protein [Pseudomonas bohemica]|uniref:hypothetical protein n=1 Tax=Pseudomonas bohemica TaxID=2044872 RepID=UPI000DA5F61A|nr:hypothetical protein [Pseudomonas bohemica]
MDAAGQPPFWLADPLFSLASDLRAFPSGSPCVRGAGAWHAMETRMPSYPFVYICKLYIILLYYT